MHLDLTTPIGVFDAGIGSYAVAALIRRHYPQQDIVYLADRASFPYGAKSKSELGAVVLRAIQALQELGCTAIVLASNAPSVMVLDDLLADLTLPVIGIYPPVREAVDVSSTKHIAVLGVQALVKSPQIQAYIQANKGNAQVAVFNASPLVDLVESGQFLSQPAMTQIAVNQFMEIVQASDRLTDTCTLSSTHLPWLKPFFEQAAPAMIFLDPANKVISLLAPFVSQGAGKTVCVATQSAVNSLADLRSMLATLGVEIEPRLLTL